VKPLLNFSFSIIHRSVLYGILPFIILKPCQGEWWKGGGHLIEAVLKLCSGHRACTVHTIEACYVLTGVVGVDVGVVRIKLRETAMLSDNRKSE
jgi:hypothetical protein